MRVSGLRWTAYRIPFRVGFSASWGAISHREGLILRLQTDLGIVGLGEAAPVPGRGGGSLGDALAVLRNLGASLLGRPVGEIPALLDEAGRGDAAMAAVRCAVDTAALDATAKAEGVRVAELLADGVCPSVEVSAIVGAAAADEAAAQAAAAGGDGFQCVKLKVGAAGSLEEERRRVSAVREALGPGVRLRIDANGAWGAEQALEAIQGLEMYGLEMVEQPVPPGNLAVMAQVRSAVGVPIAADEDVTGVEAAERVLEAGAADVLVVKPMVVGGLRAGRRIIELAAAAGVPVVVTSALESGVGVAAALHLAATLPRNAPACGLATGSLLAGDVVTRPLTARRGRMELPEGPGLGVEVDEAELTRYAGIEQRTS